MLASWTLLLLSLGCGPAPARSAQVVAVPPTPTDPVWPQSGAPLVTLPLRAPRNLKRRTVFLMAGHANGPEKMGNTGVHGQIEAETNHDTVLALAAHLESLDLFDVVIGREGDAQPSYPARIAHAERIGADVFVELHTDSRGDLYGWADLPNGDEALRAENDAGFSVLYNETTDIGPQRRRLAAITGESLAAAGFPPYPGCHYDGLYDQEGTPGVFIDRRGLMMLRRPTVPSIIIETHNARDFEESLRWRESATIDAFSAAMADALVRYGSDE